MASVSVLCPYKKRMYGLQCLSMSQYRQVMALILLIIIQRGFISVSVRGSAHEILNLKTRIRFPVALPIPRVGFSITGHLFPDVTEGLFKNIHLDLFVVLVEQE